MSSHTLANLPNVTTRDIILFWLFSPAISAVFLPLSPSSTSPIPHLSCSADSEATSAAGFAAAVAAVAAVVALLGGWRNEVIGDRRGFRVAHGLVGVVSSSGAVGRTRLTAQRLQREFQGSSLDSCVQSQDIHWTSPCITVNKFQTMGAPKISQHNLRKLRQSQCWS